MKENSVGREGNIPQSDTPIRQMPESRAEISQMPQQINEKRVDAAPHPELSQATNIPTNDSPDFLQKLDYPDSEERQLIHEQIVGSLQARIARTLMAESEPTIRFSARKYPGDNAIKPTNSPDGNAHYTLTDSGAFWQMLDERPQDFSVDCLNILPITIIGATREVLIERGHDPEEIDKLLTGMTFHGDRTELTVDGEKLRLFGDDTKPDRFTGEQYRSFETPVTQSQIEVQVTLDDEDQFKTAAFNFDVEPGDICGVNLAGLQNRPDFGNADSQNCMILNTVAAHDADTPIQVFAHRTNVEDRDANLVAVFNMLAKEVKRRDLSLAEGGFSFAIARVDYATFYAELATQLTKTKMK